MASPEEAPENVLFDNIQKLIELYSSAPESQKEELNDKIYESFVSLMENARKAEDFSNILKIIEKWKNASEKTSNPKATITAKLAEFVKKNED
jgi:hypothetical protein